jgi:YVTN family beta-propeller protein
MKKKNFMQAFALCAAMAAPFLTGCKDDDDRPEPPVVESEYIYVLNSGNFGSNDAGLSMYNVDDGVVTKDIFEARNGRRLGDTGQDLAVYGSKMYIAVYGESTVEVTDLEAKSITQIRTEGQPRYFALDGGKVYVTYYNGYVARIDTATLSVEAKVQVGRNPEQMTAANGKLYVANSGGLDLFTETGADKTVSVIDLATFTETKKIEVAINPCNIVSDDRGYVYVVSMGNYANIPGALQKIDSKTDNAPVVMEDLNGTYLAVLENTLYTIHTQYGADGTRIDGFYSWDAANNRLLSDRFIGTTEIARPFQINADKTSGDLYITESDYVTDGKVYLFDRTGKFVTGFEAGLNPVKAARVKIRL